MHEREMAPGASDQPILNDPAVKAEVEAVFARYEQALVTNDLATLDALFWDDPRTVRFGGGENLYGIEAIRAFRRQRPSQGLARDLSDTIITTFGRDFATAATLYMRPTTPGRVGRQMQTFVRFAEGWKIVAAHISEIATPVGG